MGQDMILGFTANAGALAICALAITLYAGLTRSPAEARQRIETRGGIFCLTLGVIFGATAAGLIVLSTIVRDGAVIDLRAAPLILSGVFGGPLAAGVTIVLGTLARVYVGGGWMVGGVLGICLYGASGLALSWGYTRWTGRKVGIAQLVPLALIGTCAALPGFFVGRSFAEGAAMLGAFTPMLFLKNLLGVVLLGTSLLVTFRILSDRWQLALVTADLEHRILAEKATSEGLALTVGELEHLVHTVSHDLRGPLITLRGFLDLMDEARARDDTSGFEHARDRVVRSADALNSIVISVLDHNRLSQGVVHAESVSVKEIFTEVTETLGFLEDAPGPIARFVGADQIINAQPTSLRQVILNSVSNAARHSGRGADLLVECQVSRQVSQNNKTIDVVTISDNGTEIPDDRRVEVFRKFYRLTKDDEGSGLGLAIVDKIAKLHRGRAWVTGNAHGGTSIHIGFAAPQTIRKTA